MDWKEALNRLNKGNLHFVSDNLERRHQDSIRKKELTKGQNPFAIILSCADSRVVPELAFDAGLGELFVVRVAGNVANTSSIASIEYAVANLGVKLIVIMGHGSCGAVAAAIDGGDAGPNLNQLVALIQPAVNQSSDKEVNTVVKENVKITSKSLVEKSAIISSAVNKKELQIVTAFYNLESGAVDFNL